MKRCLWIVCICLVCLTIAAAASPTQASAPLTLPILPTDGVGWAVEMDVRNGVLIGRWIITIWRETAPGIFTRITDFPVSLSCTLVGAVTVGNNAVNFNGGHIACPRADLPSTVYSLTNGVIQLPPTGDMLFQGVIAEAKVGKTFLIPGVTTYLASDSSGLDYSLYANTRREAYLDLSLADSALNPYVTSSLPFRVTQPAWWRSEQLDCDDGMVSADFAHIINGSTLNTDPSPCYFRFSMGPATTYIGYDGVGSMPFIGKMLYLMLDPNSKGPGIVTGCDPQC